MAWFVGQSLFVIVAAFLLGVLVSWLWWGRRRPAPVAATAATDSAGHAAYSGRAGVPAPPRRPGPATAAEPAPVAAGPAELPAGAATEPGPEAATEAPTAQPDPVVPEATLPAAPETDTADTVPIRTAADTAEAAHSVAPIDPPETAPAAADTAEAAHSAAPTDPSGTAPAAAEAVDTAPAAADLVDTAAAAADLVDTAAAAADPAVPAVGRATVEAPGSGVAQPVAVRVPRQRRPAGAAGQPADDLERIEGIGPKMSAALVNAGISRYRQLAAADEAALRRAIEAAGLTFAPSLVTWARQARLLADGDEAGFADLTRRLVAGRDVGRV